MTEKTHKLTDVDGVGTKTAKALVAAGIGDVAALAAIDLASPPKLDGFNGQPAWTDWVASAKKLGEETTVPSTGGTPRPVTPESASVIASAAASEDEQQEGAGQPHPAGSGPIGEDPYDGPVLVVTGPKTGFYRAGFRFDATPRELTPSDFGDGIEAARKFIAIYREPKLIVTLRHPDGSLIEIDPAAIEAADAALAGATTEDEVRQAVAQISVAMTGEPIA